MEVIRFDMIGLGVMAAVICYLVPFIISYAISKLFQL